MRAYNGVSASTGATFIDLGGCEGIHPVGPHTNHLRPKYWTSDLQVEQSNKMTYLHLWEVMVLHMPTLWGSNIKENRMVWSLQSWTVASVVLLKSSMDACSEGKSQIMWHNLERLTQALVPPCLPMQSCQIWKLLKDKLHKINTVCRMSFMI